MSNISIRQFDHQNHCNVFLLSNVFTAEECKRLIEKSEGVGFKGVPPTGGKQLSWSGIDASEVRINERVAYDDAELSQTIWKRIQAFVPTDLNFRANIPDMTGDYIDSKTKGREWKAKGVNDRMRFVKYGRKDQFLRHMDGTYMRDVITTSTANNGNNNKTKVEEGNLIALREQSFLSIILYLNDDFEGGNTVFYDNNSKKEIFSVQPKTGSVLLMLHENLHEGAQVSRGTKYILRTDVLYRKQVTNVDATLSKAGQNAKKLEKHWKQGAKEIAFDWQKVYHPSCKLYTD